MEYIWYILAALGAGTGTGLAVFLLYCRFPFWKSLPPVLAGAAVGAAAELFSPGEYNTVTVPAAILAVLLLFLV